MFIQQADNTEIFCSVSEDLFDDIYRKVSHQLAEAEDSNKLEIDELSGTSELTKEEKLIEAIRSRGQDFCSETEAQNSLNFLIDLLTNLDFPSLVEELFEIEVSEQQYTLALTSKKSLAKWIRDNEEPYFIKMIYDQEEYETKEKVEYEESHNSALASILGTQKRIEYRPVTRYKDVLSDYEITAPSPSQTVIISLKPKEEVLPWFKIFFTYIFSKSKLTLFYKHEMEKETSWNNRILPDNNQWKTKHCQLKNKNNIEIMVNESFEMIVQSITDDISSGYEFE